MPLNSDDIKYLKNKHQGGRNNSKGNTYENFYAVYCIALLMSKYLDHLDDVYLSSQLELCFVDDLLIKEPTEHLSYHQIKDVQNLTWNTENVAYDFQKQKELSTERNEDFELKIVHSKNPSKIDNIPKDIAVCTTSLYYPSSESINKLLLEYKPLKNAILNITANSNASDDELSGIATALLGIWAGCNQRAISLKWISNEILKISKGRNNIKTFPNVRISNQCKEILDNINIKYYTCGIMLYWSSPNGKMQGSTEWTLEKERKLLELRPNNFWDFVELLN